MKTIFTIFTIFTMFISLYFFAIDDYLTSSFFMGVSFLIDSIKTDYETIFALRP